MKIYQDINLSEFEFWSGAKAWAAEFTSEELDKIGEILLIKSRGIFSFDY